MKNWVVKLLLLLFIPSFVGILFTVILGFNPGGWLQITTYALPPLLTLAGGAFIVASRWKIPFLILMAAASMAFNIPLQNWLFHSADEVVRYHAVTDLYNLENNALYFTFDTLEVDYAHTSCHLTSDSHTALSGIIHLQSIESKIQSIILQII